MQFLSKEFLLSSKIRNVAIGNVVMIFALLLNLFTDTMCKGFLIDYTAPQVVFFRTSSRLIPIIIICVFCHYNPFKTHKRKEHILRAIIASVNTMLFIAAYKYSAMTEVHAIGYMTALFVLPFSYFILGEKISGNIVLSIFLGLLGALLILRPNLSAVSYLNLGALLALFGAIFSALNNVLIRRLTQTENIYVIMFYHNMVLFLLSLLIALEYWIPIQNFQNLFFSFFLVGILGTLSQYLIHFAFSITKASELAVTCYVIAIPVMLVDIFFWNIQPNMYIISGLLLIIFCNYLVISRKSA